MKPGFMAPAGTLEKKPPHGQPCNRCGLCCVATLCPLGKHVFGQELGPCPALSHDDAGLAVCGLIVYPERHASIRALVEHGAKKLGDAAVILNGAGQGCDARFNGEPADLSFYERLREYDRKNRAAAKAAKRTWGFR